MPFYYMKNPAGEIFQTMHPEYHKECEQLPKKIGKELYQQQTIVELKKLIKPGDRIYVNITRVSASGMSRRMRFYVINKGELVVITERFSIVTGWGVNDDGVSVSGCGMNMAFHAVYTLGAYLWPKGTPKPHGTRNGQPDRDGGYALKYVCI